MAEAAEAVERGRWGSLMVMEGPRVCVGVVGEVGFATLDFGEGG